MPGVVGRAVAAWSSGRVLTVMTSCLLSELATQAPHCAGSRTIAWLQGLRRLRIRWERHDDIHEAFPGFAACLTTHRRVQRPVPRDVFVRTS